MAVLRESPGVARPHLGDERKIRGEGRAGSGWRLGPGVPSSIAGRAEAALGRWRELRGAWR